MRCPKCGHEMSEKEIKHLWCTKCNAEFSDKSELRSENDNEPSLEELAAKAKMLAEEAKGTDKNTNDLSNIPSAGSPKDNSIETKLAAGKMIYSLKSKRKMNGILAGICFAISLFMLIMISIGNTDYAEKARPTMITILVVSLVIAILLLIICGMCSSKINALSEDSSKVRSMKTKIGNMDEIHPVGTLICFLVSIINIFGGISGMAKRDEVIPGKGNPFFQGKISLILGIIALIATIIWFCYQLYRYSLSKRNAEKYSEIRNAEYERARERREQEQRIIEGERLYAEQMRDEGAPWDRRYYTFPCPYCGHYKVRPANWDDKKVSVAFWGPYASQKLTDHYKCENCKKMWK